MKDEHTHRPWKVWRHPKGYTIAPESTDGFPLDCMYVVVVGEREHAERIVACVNGCEGIADPGAVKDMYEALLLVVRRDGRTRADLESVARAALDKADGR